MATACGIGSNIDLLRRARPACECCAKEIVLAMESGTLDSVPCNNGTPRRRLSAQRRIECNDR
ncbi:hypothetical protein PUN4_500045 [Paraburkholderia unamae]|nr:hypothetical protein PUN4_500045 [Paraburkholderia unamae]